MHSKHLSLGLSASAKLSLSEESSESEDEWMAVYRKCFFPEVGGNLEGNYYETCGGGPQGGGSKYILMCLTGI